MFISLFFIAHNIVMLLLCQVIPHTEQIGCKVLSLTVYPQRIFWYLVTGPYLEPSKTFQIYNQSL